WLSSIERCPYSEDPFCRFQIIGLIFTSQEYQVDLALWGHEHAYQRTCAVYKEECVESGNATVHVIVGMGGQKHSTSYPPTKPSWLDHFDDKYYGVSRLTANSTDLVLEYLASEDGVPKINDVVTLTHET
ncbi:Nucleotide pyrophosphatase/phosphodiesterase (Fragments), partial [Geodia barretti]